MPAVARITWRNNFEIFLPLVSIDSITSEELTRKESLSSNQSTVYGMYSAYREFDTLPLLLYYELLIPYIAQVILLYGCRMYGSRVNQRQ